MSKINKDDLKALYRSSDINELWQSYQNERVIEHPNLGLISPNEYRQNFYGKPCPFCGKKMVHGKVRYSTQSKQEAVSRGYQYKDANGKDYINQVGCFSRLYFHPHYVTLDHKLNKARCPELLFEASNLQIMCWKCNQKKSDNNNFEAEQTSNFVSDLAREALNRYKNLGK